MNILIVDDEAGALRDLLRVIKKAAPEAAVFTAQDAEAALAFCADHRIDVAFLDIRMPGMDGLSLAAELKRGSPLVNLIMVTAYPEYALDALRLYISDYILKPANPEDVKRALQNLRHPVGNPGKGLFVRCFGQFEVFYDGEPVRFGRSKAKELFAYLIDRRGASVTNMQLRAVLWPEAERDDEKQRQYFAQIVHELSLRLDELGLSDIFLHRRDSYAIVPDRIPCDYYLALTGSAQTLPGYDGEYMSQYDWVAYRGIPGESKTLFAE